MTDQLAFESTDEIVRLSKRLDALHQLLYTRGGIRPSNAAVEELSKLLLVRIGTSRHPEAEVEGYGPIGRVMEEAREGRDESVESAKAAFKTANTLPELGARLPDGKTQTLWPIDEPLRISRADVLSEAVNILWDIELGRSKAYDPIGTAFDVFLRGRYENAGGLGTYLTPETVVNLMVTIGLELLAANSTDPSEIGLMGDPCCGSGRFLVALAHSIRTNGLSIPEADLPGILFGADQSTSAVAMARVNLMAAGLDSPEVFSVEDSITDTWVAAATGKFSLILTNPPFGEGKYDDPEGIRATAELMPRLQGARRIDPALAFVAKCLDLLAPNGVLGIILPDGVLDGPPMRDLVLTSGHSATLEGVVSLPSATFAPAGTTAKTSVAFLRRTQRPSTKRVFLARADHVGYLMKKGSVAPDPAGDDLPVIAEAVVEFLKEGSAGTAFDNIDLPHLDDLASLDASSSSAEAAAARHALIERGGSEINGFLEFEGRRRVPINPEAPFVSVLHVDEMGNVDWASAADYRPTTPGQVAEAGDLIVSLLNPSKFRAAVIPASQPEVHCSAEFGVFKATINPFAALAILQHPLCRTQVAPLGRGTSSSRRRIEPEELLTLIAPPFTDSQVSAIGAATERALSKVSEGKSELVSAYRTL